MNATELIFAAGTSEAVQKVARRLPPFDLLKAYRDARIAFNTGDIVIAVTDGDVSGFTAMPRPVYVEEAFRRWTDEQKKLHPLPKESARKKLKMPDEFPAFWLVIQFPDDGAIMCCAIGAYLRESVTLQ